VIAADSKKKLNTVRKLTNESGDSASSSLTSSKLLFTPPPLRRLHCQVSSKVEHGVSYYMSTFYDVLSIYEMTLATFLSRQAEEE
jgi:hypothetical protein